MNFEEFTTNVSKVDFGKALPTAIYIHRSGILKLPPNLSGLIYRAIRNLKLEESEWDILKLYKRDFKFSLLHYPGFDSYPYPPLHTSYSIDLSKLTLRKADYSEAENPPILHRRENFLHPSDPRVNSFKGYTQEGERIGLYEQTQKIGSLKGWERTIRSKGYELTETGSLQRLGINHAPETTNGTQEIQRHKTAISRNSLSSPMFILAKKNYLNGNYSVLDYGCGRGDDLRELEAHNIDAIGWDPVHRPETDLEPCDIVNLGFVINVIEDKNERDKTLKRAFDLSLKLLVISAMLGNEKIYQKFSPYKDGVITSKNTFQKYYFQGELQHYIETALSENAIALGPGIFVVFKDKVEEQNYLLERQKARIHWNKLSSKPAKPFNEKIAKELYDRNKELYDHFWLTCLDLGRIPCEDEFEHLALIAQTGGSYKKIFNLCTKKHGVQLFEHSKKSKVDELITYFALEFFTKRKPYRRMPDGLKRDIRSFFTSYSEAKSKAQQALFSVSSTLTIYEACITAHKNTPSILNGQHSLLLHRQHLELLPKELRIFVGCATQLYGDMENIDLIKIHIQSGKVSLMSYENFDSQPIPLLTERIKIKLREQEIDFFDYVGEYQPQPLYNKSAFINESFEDFKKQKSFDKKLERLGIKTNGDRGPSTPELIAQLRKLGHEIKGYRLYKIQDSPRNTEVIAPQSTSSVI